MTSITAPLSDDMQTWRHDFHRHPELGFEEYRTAKQVADLLLQWDIDVHTEVGGTGVVGVLTRGSSERTIGLRADMDALAISEQNTFDHRSCHDGKMHACGHDGHTAMLLGAACHLATSGNFDGTVYFIFQPAEEHGRGALTMLDDGLFERFPAQSVYAMHNFPPIPLGRFAIRAGPVMACEDNFEITLKGVGSHAAMPHMGVDPLVCGAEIVTALQTVVARTMNPSENSVISVTEFITDGTRNVIPGQVTLRGDTRSFLPEIQDHIEGKMRRIVEGVCAAHGVQGEFHYSHEFVPTINSEREAQIAYDVAQELMGAENVDKNFPPAMTSEDFGFMLQHKPGCYILIGNGGDGPGGCGLHNPGFDFNDDNLTIGADYWVRLVESQLTN